MIFLVRSGGFIIILDATISFLDSFSLDNDLIDNQGANFSDIDVSSHGITIVCASESVSVFRLDHEENPAISEMRSDFYDLDFFKISDSIDEIFFNGAF